MTDNSFSIVMGPKDAAIVMRTKEDGGMTFETVLSKQQSPVNPIIATIGWLFHNDSKRFKNLLDRSMKKMLIEIKMKKNQPKNGGKPDAGSKP